MTFRTTITLDAEQLAAIQVELSTRADAIEIDIGISDQDDQDELDMLKALIRRIEAAQRRIKRKSEVTH